MKNKQFFILIILLVIGFASISATLIINGNTKVAANLDDFNVIFIEGFLNGETNEDVVISGDKKTLTFTTNKLTNINDSARIDYKVKNISTQYDGNVTINCTNEANEYVNVTSSFDGMTLPLTDSVNMQAQEVKNGYINAELTKAVTEEQEIKVTCKIEVNATSRTNYAYSLVFDSNGGSKIDDKSVALNESYGKLEEPIKEGYTFIGWFNEDDVRVDGTTILDTKGDRNLHAKWETNLYDLNIVVNEHGTSEEQSLSIPYGETRQTKIIPDEDYYISSINCDNGYTVDYNFNTIEYGEQTLNIKNNNSIKQGTCRFSLKQGVYRYDYKGREEEFIAPLDGNYKIELWGASGGTIYTRYPGGKGGYSSGNLNLDSKKSLFIYVGGEGSKGDFNTGGLAGYNGGAKGQNSSNYSGTTSIGSGGGGATDVRLTNGNWNSFESLRSRIIVASGGGGASTYGLGGFGGSLTGSNGTVNTGSDGIAGLGYGATQTGGGSCTVNGSNSLGGNCGGSFGYANVTTYYSDKYINPGAGGGGGYYGGGSSSTGISGYAGGGGGGGSSFISGHIGCDAISENSTASKIIHTGQSNHYSGYIFTNTNMMAGNELMPSHDGKTNMRGNTGNGYAKITYLGK